MDKMNPPKKYVFQKDVKHKMSIEARNCKRGKTKKEQDASEGSN